MNGFLRNVLCVILCIGVLSLDAYARTTVGPRNSLKSETTKSAAERLGQASYRSVLPELRNTLRTDEDRRHFAKVNQAFKALLDSGNADPTASEVFAKYREQHPELKVGFGWGEACILYLVAIPVVSVGIGKILARSSESQGRALTAAEAEQARCNGRMSRIIDNVELKQATAIITREQTNVD